MTTSTLTTEGLLQAARTQLLTHQTPAGDTLADTLADRLYLDQAPDTVTFPYGVLRFQNRQRVQNMRIRGDLELMLFDRPRSKAAALGASADIAEEALLGWRDASDGLVWSDDCQRDVMPTFDAPADHEVVQLRLLFEIVAYPRLLTQYART